MQLMGHNSLIKNDPPLNYGALIWRLEVDAEYHQVVKRGEGGEWQMSHDTFP